MKNFKKIITILFIAMTSVMSVSQALTLSQTESAVAKDASATITQDFLTYLKSRKYTEATKLIKQYPTEITPELIHPSINIQLITPIIYTSLFLEKSDFAPLLDVMVKAYLLSSGSFETLSSEEKRHRLSLIESFIQYTHILASNENDEDYKKFAHIAKILSSLIPENYKFFNIELGEMDMRNISLNDFIKNKTVNEFLDTTESTLR